MASATKRCSTPATTASSTPPFPSSAPRSRGAPPAGASEVAFDGDTLFGLRGLVAARATDAGLNALRTGDLALAEHEVAANSVRHGGGVVRLHMRLGMPAVA
jgi:hypothetical protein